MSIIKKDCVYCDGDGDCMKGLPGTPCDVVGCVAWVEKEREPARNMGEDAVTIFHRLLDNYLNEPEDVRKAGTRLHQYVKAEVPIDDCGRPGTKIRTTYYRLYVIAEIVKKEEK